ncbi:LysR family transcriptional regulator [Burkholderia sp. Ac-20353]|uniref:LysR family transcriptional regulator n=1 Tax=Burkholderia sp. Ac-20353 TaxID=2703894 RepID=UPI00197BDEF8|nr:LysR family transcriptional regulator [Burkholderia sp. Ac-20353]MBN3785985.1 LysR family transcriptional regulator [Burkholderia sp. Ac-20353]
MDRSLEMSVFVAVVEAGSFVGAAEGLRMSKAAVSRHVDALESRLGSRLLQRTTRRLSLTEEGRLFHQRAKDILSAMNDAEAEVSSRTHQPGGVVRINVPLSFGITHLAPLWGRFMALYPQIDLDIVLNDRVVDLVDEGYDLAVRISALPDSSLVSRKLAATRMVVCASPGYLQRYGVPSHPAELAEHRVLAYTYLAGRDEWQFQGPDGEITVRTRARVYSSNGDTCRAIALDDGGIILQPSFMIDEDLRAGRLSRLMPEFQAIELGIYAVYPTRKQLPFKVRCLIDFLVDAFRDPPWNAIDSGAVSDV